MSIGKIGEFNLQADNWRLYVERIEQYFIVNGVKEEHQVPTLITVIGAECYELLVDLCTPEKPSTKSFKELADILERHLLPKPSILAERYKFRNRKQECGESIANYVAALRKMSGTCDFKRSLEENLRDQFVCNITSELIRQRLFGEDILDFQRAYKLALSLEAAEKDAAAVFQDHSGKATSACNSVQYQARASSRRSAGEEPRRARSTGAGARGDTRRGTLVKAHEAAARAQPTGATYSRITSCCSACGGQHHVNTCRFGRYVCRACNRQGHLKRVCPLLNSHFNVEVSEKPSENEESDEVIIDINRVSLSQCKPIVIRLDVQGCQTNMEVDTGSAISCISYEAYKELFRTIEIQPCKLVLRYYTGELVRPVGLIMVKVKYKGITKDLELYVVDKGTTMLLGRQWLIELGIALSSKVYSAVNNIVGQAFNFTEFSSRYCEVFADGLGRFTGGKVSIYLREGSRPVFMRARPLAYALREPVERGLEQLVRDGILTPVQRSDWATPIVPVLKKDGTVRICADYKLTLNKVLEIDRYPLPKVEDLLARLHGGKKFSKIDLSQAYAQFELDESRRYTVINTHKGLFMYNRLVYGLSSSPGIFQRHLEQLFADLDYVGVFLDDVIITGQDDEQHIKNLNAVFDRLKTNGLRVKKEKCSFFAESIEYLGHVISERGVHTCPSKVKAITETPAPTNLTDLRAFIGMVMYYAKFIKNISTVLTPLYRLLRADVKFEWDGDCEIAFKAIKKALTSSEVLTHYSTELPLVLTTDASSTGVGAVLSHITPEGERPVAYASRTLTAAERVYAQIDREALSIVFGVRKFHQYLYGRKFTLRTDHKPLTFIFGDKVGIPVMAASRIQRWAILLSGYNYDIEYVRSASNCADALSRLSRPTVGFKKGEESTYLNFVENFLPVTNEDVKKFTARDVILSRVLIYLQSGWPSSCTDEAVKPYFNRSKELYIDRGCIMWGYRIVVPSSLREDILRQLHVSHMGIIKTKSLARSYVWWPGIDSDVEAACRQCETCAAEAQAPPRSPPKPWPYSTSPWSRLHLDFLGPIYTKTFLVMIDASTKWLEIFEMSRTNASAVIKVLRSTFARFGLPTEVVSDQGPPFTSREFGEFLKSNGIRQSFSPVYHPSSNGAAENAVKLCKRAIKKAQRDSVDLDSALQTFLLAYRNSVHSSTGETPAMLLQRRTLRSRLDLLRSDRAVEDCVRAAQSRQVQAAGGQERIVQPGETVWARDYSSAQDKWAKGTILSQEGSNRYALKADDGRSMTRHLDQIRRRPIRSSMVFPNTSLTDGDSQENGVGENAGVSNTEDEIRVSPDEQSSGSEPVSVCPSLPPDLPLRRSERVRKPPVRYQPE